jgi:fumarate hydratase subunit beta
VEFHIQTPIKESDVRRLKVGDIIYISGDVFTSRDQAHVRTLEHHKSGHALPFDPSGKALFHCGPVVKKTGNVWNIVVAGPTTSTRLEPYQAEYIKTFDVRVVIGKGGMGIQTTNAMQEFGAVYGAFTGGAAVLAAESIKRVKAVEWLDLGIPEAVWLLEVNKFGPLIIAIDSHGNNLYQQIIMKVKENKPKILETLDL